MAHRASLAIRSIRLRLMLLFATIAIGTAYYLVTDALGHIIGMREGRRLAAIGDVTVATSADRDYINLRGIGGSTILGSGEVALILDVQALVSRSARAAEQLAHGNTGMRRLEAH